MEKDPRRVFQSLFVLTQSLVCLIIRLIYLVDSAHLPSPKNIHILKSMFTFKERYFFVTFPKAVISLMVHLKIISDLQLRKSDISGTLFEFFLKMCLKIS